MRSGTLGTDIPVVYRSRAYEQFGLLHRPVTPGPIGVVIVPAGYQYRIGPYRQHVLLARALGAHGFPSFRFDPSALGDSDGPFLDFDMDQEIEDAMETFFDHCPGLEGVVLWGICGSASAVAMRIPKDDPRVKGLILVNPWVRSEGTLARAYLRHYYLRKFVDPDFYRKLFSSGLDYRESARSFLRSVRLALRGSGNEGGSLPEEERNRETSGESRTKKGPLSDRMAEGLERTSADVLIVISEADLTGQEFMTTARASGRWKKIMRSPSVTILSIPGADHIFSESDKRAAFFDGMIKWLHGLDAPDAKWRGS